MLNGAFSFGLANTISKAAARAVSVVSYLKDNLKVYFDFKNTDLEHVGTGSANISTPSDGSGDWIEYTDATLLDAMEGIDTLTIMAWVRRDDNTGFAFITKGAYYGSNTDWGSEWQSSNGRMRFSIEQNFTAWEPPPDTYLNTWVHYAITYDKNAEGSNVHRVVNTYYNGDQDYGYGSGTPATVGTNGNNIRIGATSTGVGPLRGNIKNVGIWNRVLSKEEVRNVMYKSYSDLKGSELTNLQLWADLDTDFNGKDGNGRTITGSAAGNANIMQNLYGNNLPIMPRGVDNSKAALADLIGSGSASFDGDDDYIDCGLIDFNTDDISMVAWYKANAFDDPNAAIINNRSSSGTNIGIQIRVDSGSDDIELFTDCGSTTFSTKTDSFVPSAGVWTHVAATIDRSALQSLYIDGALQATTDISGQSSADLTNDESFKIGVDQASNFFNGNIAQVGIWVGRVLTQEEIQSISQKQYSELTTSEKTNLVSWWGLDSSLTGQNQSIVLDENDTTTTSISLNGNESTLANVTETYTANITADLTIGKTYKLIFTKAETRNSGYDQWRLGITANVIYATSSLGAGTYTLYFQATVAEPLNWQSGGGTPWQGSITNISLEEYDGNPGVLE